MTKKMITAICAALIVLVSATSMFNCYDKVAAIAHSESGDKLYYQVQYLYSDGNLETSIYAIKNRLQNIENRPASENLLTISGSEEFISTVQEVFDNNYFWRWNQHVSEDVNIHYYAIDNVSKAEVWSDEELRNLDIDSAASEYSIYIRVDFDEFGNPAVTSNQNDYYEWSLLFGNEMRNKIESYILRDSMDRSSTDSIAYEGSLGDSDFNETVHLNPITEMTFVFAVPKEMEKTGGMYWHNSWLLENMYQSNAAFYAAVITLIVFVFSLFFPIKIIQEWNWFKSLSRIKFEFLVIVLGALLSFTAFGGISMVMLTQEGMLFELISHFQLSAYLNEITLLINLLIWLIYFFLVEVSAFMIRFIFHKGLKRYIGENTCLFWILGLFVGIGRGIRELIDKIFAFDFEDPLYRSVLKIVALNFLVLSVLCCFFVFGIFLGIIYSVLLFLFLQRHLRSIHESYQILLEAARQLSSGNFNVTIDQDTGVFNSLRDAFVDLKVGFEKAVNEEVKSQRMKTELISNVSHDLKTPLTSIITYVDLLKKEGITEEERRDYINTIDRNSQRLKNLISDLFEISKANSGNVSLHLVDVDIVSLIRQVLFECQEKIEAAHLDVKMSFSSERIVLQLDSLKTYRIFENLIVNITKYALPHTRVYIDVTESENEVKIIFKNISASEITVDISEITERFVQGDKSRNTEGSGLGLAIVKSFTQLQNGSFYVDVDGDLFKANLLFYKKA